MNDFKCIEVRAPAKREYREREFRRLLRAEDTLAMHWVDRDWLRRELAEPFDGPSVVVSHHAPSNGSVAERYADDWFSPAFVSELPVELFGGAHLWVHGHTHSPFDYQVAGCRVVSNPRGYRLNDSSFENEQFDAGFVIEVPSGAASITAEPVAIRDEGVPVGLEPHDEQLQAGLRHWRERLRRADMVSVADAAVISAFSVTELAAEVERGACLGITDESGCLRFPRWQFEPELWPVVRRLADALEGDARVVLTWLETPLGALQGRTPRMAVEQGESAERILDFARSAF